VIPDPVITLDATATAAAVGRAEGAGDLDGINLIPRLSGEVEQLPDRPLFWRFWRQAAIREGKWKYIYLSDGREWLFDMTREKPEAENRIADHPEVARGLRTKLEGWAGEQKLPGLPTGRPNDAEIPYFEHFLPPGQSSR
jgi:arylsulfatase A-like enzyme